MFGSIRFDSVKPSQLSRFKSAGSGQTAWSDGSVRLTRSNRVNSVKPGQHSELTRSTQPTIFSAFRHEDSCMLASLVLETTSRSRN
ncbi:hypothetical protein HanXRQr2_Chr07g0297321 [Helianthus annuus]|uniref:Uncharacterized protein n=1 Tax=Helianthus annuus TaxID=4232 RepID=A0A9K3IL29_HELAN|nr:hypothetical protein HanXRQr2_Chr07g0297321 [Helianthus annuus]KAJ0904915.1 hypothetical protein HanPSC8_Chr07g0287841 [Helianthus annuus]